MAQGKRGQHRSDRPALRPLPGHGQTLLGSGGISRDRSGHARPAFRPVGGLLWLARHLGRRRFPGAPRASQQHLVEPPHFTQALRHSGLQAFRHGTPGPEDREDIFDGREEIQENKNRALPGRQARIKGSDRAGRSFDTLRERNHFRPTGYLNRISPSWPTQKGMVAGRAFRPREVSES